ncbi:MAG TPA: ribonucleotide-diphosphate reductase subunit beta [Bacteroidia bacterium]|nr:ribonucleotide-diphosphate reductase subunit beta [Bacteroidia bacterium]
MSIFEKRTHYKPFEYSELTNPLIEAMWASHWTHKEFSFSGDVQDFHTKLSIQEQGVIKRSLLMISQVEVAVKSYWANIGNLIPKPEIADMGAVFGGVEVIHSRAYAEILEKLGLNEEFQKLLSEDIIHKRVLYLTKYLNKVYKSDRKNICYSLCLFTLFTENVSLFSQFYTILGFNKFKNLLKDVSNVVEYTSKEENLHAEGGMALLNQIRAEHPEIFDEEFTERIRAEAEEAFKAESAIIKWILDGYSNEFLSSPIILSYIGNRLNESLEKIGIKPVIAVDKTLLKKTTWMDEMVYAQSMVDFFHKKPIDYTKKDREYKVEDLF